MAKSLDDLSDAPLTPSPATVQFIAEVDRLLDDEDCQYAADTLTGLRASAKGRDHVTDAMRDAVANIADGAERGRIARQNARRGGGGSRRYEGFGGGGSRGGGGGRWRR